jgi:hypothetical protein
MDNVMDRINKGRPNNGGSPPGEECWNHKLTLEQVEDIRARVTYGETQAALANEYGVAQTTVSKLVRGESWAWC